ncbi:MATE family efflux transporter [Myceligenerans crystallogenes]|uniref:MATE family efflux transporter n=1 Tax=Myceligenerans crystallogenes TaxID=316335 RepID=A0ABP4ZDP1_9MICO
MTRNLTAGPPARLIVRFALPLLAGNLFQQLYQFTDAIVVGRLVGVDALAAVGATGSIVFVLIGMSWGSAAGLAIPVARAFGAGDDAALRRALAAGSAVSAALALLITVVGVATARPFLDLLGTPPELVDDAAAFLVVTFLGAPVAVAFNYLTSVVRAVGDSRTPLVVLVAACVLNVGLVLGFVGVLGLGVGGAAFATVLAQFLAVLLCLVVIRGRIPQLRLRREDWRLRREDFGEPLRLGTSMGLQMSVIGIGTVILQYGVNGLGADAVAAFTAAVRVEQLGIAPLNSFGAALATYVAQNRGALDWLRVRQGVLRTTWINCGVAVALGLVVIALGVPIVRLFVGDGVPGVVAMAHQYLVINACLYVFLALLFVYRNTMQGLGNASSSTVSGIAELVLRSVAGLVLIQQFGFLGVCLAAPLAWIGGLLPVAAAWFSARRDLVGVVGRGAAAPRPTTPR